MTSRQIDFDGNIIKDAKDVNEIIDIKSLMYSLIRAENRYMVKKFYNEMDYYENMLECDWDTINEERKEKGLPKISNQDMRKAYIKQKMMEDYDEEKYLQSEYLRFQKMYDVAMKFGYEILG